MQHKSSPTWESRKIIIPRKRWQILPNMVLVLTYQHHSQRIFQKQNLPSLTWQKNKPVCQSLEKNPLVLTYFMCHACSKKTECDGKFTQYTNAACRLKQKPRPECKQWFAQLFMQSLPKEDDTPSQSSKLRPVRSHLRAMFSFCD